MPKPAPSAEAFKDVIPYMNTALGQGYVRVELESDSKAVYMTHRMNRWRMICRTRGDTIWDSFVFSRTGRTVIIKPREVIEAVSVTDADGNAISVDMEIR